MSTVGFADDCVWSVRPGESDVSFDRVVGAEVVIGEPLAEVTDPSIVALICLSFPVDTLLRQDEKCNEMKRDNPSSSRNNHPVHPPRAILHDEPDISIIG